MNFFTKLLQRLFQGPVVSPLPDTVPTPTSTPTPSPTPQTFADRLTYYLPTGSPTATGTTPKNGYTLAVSPDMEKIASMGSILKFPNGMEGRVEDRTNKRLKGTVDVFYDSIKNAVYPKGMERKVPFKILRYDPMGLKYNYGKN